MATLQEQYEIDLGTAIKNQRKGSEVLAHLYATNMKKLRAGEITEQDLAGLLYDANLSVIERFLLNGSLITARALIASETNTYFTSDEKTKILSIIDAEEVSI